MSIDSLSLSLMLVALVIIINVLVSYLRFPSVSDSAENRARLRQAINSLRLGKMLALLRIPMERYLNVVPLTVVSRHVSTCQACTELGACNRCLQKGVLQKNMGFCPNYESLLQYRLRIISH